MREEIISDELYIATASPLIRSRVGDFYEDNKREDFIVKPILKRTLFGKLRKVGAVEAISNIKLFDCYYTDNEFYRGYVCKDVEGEFIGGIGWSIDFYNDARRIIKKEVLDQYFSQTPEEAAQRLASVRNEYAESVKDHDFSFTRKMK